MAATIQYSNRAFQLQGWLAYLRCLLVNDNYLASVVIVGAGLLCAFKAQSLLAKDHLDDFIQEVCINQINLTLLHLGYL